MGAHGSIGMAVTDDDIRRKFDRLRAYCDEFGRPFDSILRSQFTMPLVLGTYATGDRPETLRVAGGDRRLLGTGHGRDHPTKSYCLLSRAG